MRDQGLPDTRFQSPVAASDGLPDAFCWTKMGTESGQQLGTIVRRKEAERQAGEGVFFWGIGGSLGDKAVALGRRVDRPRVLFSTMRSKPKPVDTNPGHVLLWTSMANPEGRLVPLPEHVVVVSRGAEAGAQKAKHYALVCYSPARLELRPQGSFDLAGFRNLGSSSPEVGASQVTAILERQAPTAGARLYDIHMTAELVMPYFVKLAGPVSLTGGERALLDEAAEACDRDPAHWLILARSLRAAALARLGRGAL